MTASTYIRLICDGLLPGCDGNTRDSRASEALRAEPDLQIRWARAKARKDRGWMQVAGFDLCPACIDFVLCLVEEDHPEATADGLEEGLYTEDLLDILSGYSDEQERSARWLPPSLEDVYDPFGPIPFPKEPRR